MRIIELKVSTDGSGDGSATYPYPISGYLLAWDINFSASADAGTDTTLTCVSTSGAANTSIDSVANSNTDARRYPLAAANLPGAAVGTDPVMPIVFSGRLKLTVAGGGASVTNAVVATVYIGTDI